jgi:hypothetical protein
MNKDLLQGIINSSNRQNLVEYLKQVQSYIADIRNGEYSTETRKMSVDVIEKLLINKLKSPQDIESNTDDYK